MFTALPWQRF